MNNERSNCSNNRTEDINVTTTTSTDDDNSSTIQALQSKCHNVTAGTTTGHAQQQQPQQNIIHGDDVGEGSTTANTFTNARLSGACSVLPAVGTTMTDEECAYSTVAADMEAEAGLAFELGISLDSNLLEGQGHNNNNNESDISSSNMSPSNDLPEAILVQYAEVVDDEEALDTDMTVTSGRLILPWYQRSGFYVGLLLVIGALITAVLVTASVFATNDDTNNGAATLKPNSNSSASPAVSSGPSFVPGFAPTEYVQLQQYALRSVFDLTSSHDNHNADNSSSSTTTSWINDDGWNMNSNDTTASGIYNYNSNDVNVCQWYGITCDTVRNQYVTQINLPNNGLSGDMNAVSQVLCAITTLEDLNLQSNDLTGDMEVIGGGLLLLSRYASLKFVDLRHNDIVGRVTEEVCNASNAAPSFDLSLYLDCTIECSCCDQPCECVDLVVDWVDDFGRNCIWYEQNNECDMNTAVTSRSDINSKSTTLSHTTACCVCGGGTVINPVPSPSPSASPTINYANLQRTILLEIYTAMNGEDWFNDANWKNDSISVCDWYGVVCSTDVVADASIAGQIKGAVVKDEEIVIALQLSVNNLSGTIPSSIGLLNNLEEIEMNENELVGAIPTEFGLLQSLQTLSVHSNSLSGTIPTELGLLGDSLTTISMWSNYLDGTIPTELGLLRSVSTMFISNNRLTGTIPLELTSMTAMFILKISINRLTGSIPTQIGLFPSLLGISMSYNQLSGTLPSEIGYLSSTYGFIAGGNSLSGTLPTEIGVMRRLGILSLNENKLSGTIPSEMFGSCNGMFSFIENVYMGYNNLSGSIPSELGRCSKLNQLQLRHNDLTGTVPHELGVLQSLRTLYLEENDLTGTMPESVCALTADGTGLITDLNVDCDEILCDCCSSCNVVYTTQLSDNNN